MKNIHVIPTTNPSKLYLSDYGKELNLSALLRNYTTGQHIYITNSEEPKLDEWGINLHNNVIFHCNGFASTEETKKYHRKIILTTDQDLINDGVQAIDDEFLEWFVKNLSCDVVEVETYFKRIGVETDANGYREMDVLGKDYRIIIPKEEPIVEDLNYWKANAEEDYMRVPISVLKYISELESKMYNDKEVEDLLISCKNRFGGSGLEEYTTDSEVKTWFDRQKKK